MKTNKSKKELSFWKTILISSLSAIAMAGYVSPFVPSIKAKFSGNSQNSPLEQILNYSANQTNLQSLQAINSLQIAQIQTQPLTTTKSTPIGELSQGQRTITATFIPDTSTGTSRYIEASTTTNYAPAYQTVQDRKILSEEDLERKALEKDLKRVMKESLEKKVAIIVPSRTKPFNDLTGCTANADQPQKSKKEIVISDDFFRYSDYLTKEQIKSFLEKNKSCLRNTGVEEVIINCAQKYDINPLILLARLQVEQGLVEKQKARKRSLDYARGYGAFDKGKWLKSRGLYDQIENAARILSNHFENAGIGTEIKIDGGRKIVKPENRSDYAFFKYTPWTKGVILNKKIIKEYAREISQLTPQAYH